MKRVVSFIGDYYHPHNIIFPALKEACEQISDTFLEDYPFESIIEVLKEKPNVVIISAGGNIVAPMTDGVLTTWFNEEIDAEIEKYVLEGGSLFVHHSGLAGFGENSKYSNIVEGFFVSHPNEHTDVRYSSDGYPFSAIPFDFTVLDEFYIVNVNQCETNVFLKAESEHGEQVAGWFHEKGKGKVISIVPTHNEKGFENKDMKRLLKEAIMWCF